MCAASGNWIPREKWVGRQRFIGPFSTLKYASQLIHSSGSWERLE